MYSHRDNIQFGILILFVFIMPSANTGGLKENYFIFLNQCLLFTAHGDYQFLNAQYLIRVCIFAALCKLIIQ
uniref:Uncharacterized protein n=1 Tax=Anguilla anguilla TaxID=7936 RepID=A0A0E9X578_ANGAN